MLRHHFCRCKMLSMRTTVTLDDDTVHLVRQRMLATGATFKQAINDAIRAGAAERATVQFRTPVKEMGIPTVDLTKALRLAGELEDESLIAAMRRGS